MQETSLPENVQLVAQVPARKLFILKTEFKSEVGQLPPEPDGENPQ